MRRPYHIPTIRAAIARSATLVLKTHSYRTRERDYLDEVLGFSLDAVGRPDLRIHLAYCLHELGSNAKKANTKRAFFLEQGLDLSNPADYVAGMKRFKDETIPRIDYYLRRQRELGLFVKFRFQRHSAGLTVSVVNNAVPTACEWERIQEKLRIASEIESIPEAVPRLEDETEGAGLGIVMMVMMLRNLGLSRDSLSIEVRGSETMASLHVPVSRESNNGIAPGLVQARPMERDRPANRNPIRNV